MSLQGDPRLTSAPEDPGWNTGGDEGSREVPVNKAEQEGQDVQKHQQLSVQPHMLLTLHKSTQDGQKEAKKSGPGFEPSIRWEFLEKCVQTFSLGSLCSGCKAAELSHFFTAAQNSPNPNIPDRPCLSRSISSHPEQTPSLQSIHGLTSVPCFGSTSANSFKW